MRRPIAIVSVVMMLSLFAPIFWHNETAKAVSPIPAPEPEYALSSHHYLPIRHLEPVW
jgi:hypothetical protein